MNDHAPTGTVLVVVHDLAETRLFARTGDVDVPLGVMAVGYATVLDRLGEALRQRYQLQVGETTVERIVMQLFSKSGPAYNGTMDVKGRHVATGVPTIVTFKGHDIADVVETAWTEITDAVVAVVNGDGGSNNYSCIVVEGVVAAGLVERLERRTGLNVFNVR